MGFFDSILFIVLSITIFLFQSQLLHMPIVTAKDTLFPGDKQGETSTLISPGGTFTMGFYKNPTNLTYLGIWRTNELESRVWIANRDLPILHGEAILTMDDSGTVRVMNRSGATLFDISDNKVGGLGNNKNNTRAMLKDSGNFVVYDIATNITIWESFDHLTDILIPGMKLGYNLTTKKNWELTSWANNKVPTSGAFTMRLEHYQNSPQLLMYRREELYWASGPWDKTTRTFKFLPISTPNTIMFDLTYDPSGLYLIAQMIGSMPSMLKLSTMGGFTTDSIFSEANFCIQLEDGTSNGCVVSALPYCRAPKEYSLYTWIRTAYDFGPDSKIDDNSSISLGDCMKRCLNDCDCKACWTYYDNGTGCIYGTTEEDSRPYYSDSDVLALYRDIHPTVITMDKSWMELEDRACHAYRACVKNFIEVAWEKVSKDGKMICPCRKCNNAHRDTKSEIEFHLVRHGIMRNYTTWCYHGERLTSEHNESEDAMYEDLDEQIAEQVPTGEALKFYKLLEDSKKSLYPGCQTFSKLSFIITMLHIKCLNGWSDKSFTMLLKVLIKAFHQLPSSFPASYRKAKSLVQDLGLDYQKIDACHNDCMLFRGIHENAENCITCGASRWKDVDTENKRKVAMKTLRYFPLIPRLQRLFMCSKTAKYMTWHHWGRVNDGLLRHPADSEAWKGLDRFHPQFAIDHRNVRLGLATDGFNPFGIMISTYSIWLVMLVVYNLPPWMCLKKPFTFLCLLIPGRKPPGNDIDVYLQPIIGFDLDFWLMIVGFYVLK